MDDIPQESLGMQLPLAVLFCRKAVYFDQHCSTVVTSVIIAEDPLFQNGLQNLDTLHIIVTPTT